MAPVLGDVNYHLNLSFLFGILSYGVPTYITLIKFYTLKIDHHYMTLFSARVPVAPVIKCTDLKSSQYIKNLKCFNFFLNNAFDS